MSEPTEIALIETNALQPAVLFAGDGLDELLADIEQKARTIVPDLSTAKGRKEIASMAHKVARTKTALDDMGKALVAEWKAKAGKVDESRRLVRERLDALKAEVREPLDQWEQHQQACRDTVAYIKELGATAATTDPSNYDALLTDLDQIRISDDMGEYKAIAEAALTEARERLETAIKQHREREAERAELERLRAEKAEAEERERQRIEAERAEKERQAREAAEAKVRAEREERIRQEAAEAERKAAAERERQAREEAQRKEREQAEAIQRAEQAAKDAEARAQRAAQEAREQAAREAAEQRRREDEAAAKREADKQHRGNINRIARDALVAVGLDPVDAQTAIEAIAKGQIPNVRISY